jgi:hypothetical protein
VRLFGRTFSLGSLGLPASAAAKALAQARAAELRGELAQAAALFAQAGRLDEAARVMVLRGDAETDASARLRHYVQAVATAPEGGLAGLHARRKRAAALVTMATDAPMTATLRQELAQAARDLETAGDPARAAEAFAHAGDTEGEIRALARAGNIEKLDAVLAARQLRDREALAQRSACETIAMLVATGRRRDAVSLARASTDDAVRGRGREIEAKRVAGTLLWAAVGGRPLTLALGKAIVIGRGLGETDGEPGEGSVGIASAAVSRRHLIVYRRGSQVLVRDLGSRNGTTLRGLALEGETAVGDGIELRLGREVPLSLCAAGELAGAIAIELGGARYVAPLGPAALGVGRWAIDRGDDGWFELASDDAPPAFAGAIRLAATVTLLQGDAIARERGGAPAFEVRDRDR